MGKLMVGGGGKQKKSPTNGDSRSAREVVERTRQILAAADRNVSGSSYIIYTQEATRCRGDAAVYFSRSRDTEMYATADGRQPPPPRYVECAGDGDVSSSFLSPLHIINTMTFYIIL